MIGGHVQCRVILIVIVAGVQEVIPPRVLVEKGAADVVAIGKVCLIVHRGCDGDTEGMLIIHSFRGIAPEVTLTEWNEAVTDANLVIMYAAWLWRRRDTMEAMPRMLRWQLNNRVFSEKMVTNA